MAILRFMTAGSVDDGKSTLIGRLFYDAGMILDDQMSAISQHGLNLAYFTDGLKEEREDGITIDVAYRYFETPTRKFIVADAPGHKEFTRNMVTGATHSDCIIVLIDATAGVIEQTRLHIFLAQWLGVKSVIGLVNKMDLISYDHTSYQAINIKLNELGVHTIIPISALLGENVLKKSTHMPWYNGPTLFDFLHELPLDIAEASNRDVIFPIQLTRDNDALGTLNSGTINVGDSLYVNGGPLQTIVNGIAIWPHDLQVATAGGAYRLKLDRRLNRGDILTCAPSKSSSVWTVEWCYLLEQTSSTEGNFVLRHETAEIELKDLQIKQQFNIEKQQWENSISNKMEMNGIYGGQLQLTRAICAKNDTRVAIFDVVSGDTVASGILKGMI